MTNWTPYMRRLFWWAVTLSAATVVLEPTGAMIHRTAIILGAVMMFAGLLTAVAGAICAVALGNLAEARS